MTMSETMYLLVEHADGEVYYEIPGGGEGARQKVKGDIDREPAEGWEILEQLAHDAVAYNVESIGKGFTPFADEEAADS